MDFGFKDRVDKVFGSISSSSSWSLTDAHVERREWRRDEGHNRDDDQIPVFTSCQANEENDWDIRSSIGLDSTLDYEEEEDAYDKMAEGRDNRGDRLYMKDVTDHGPYLNSHNVLPRSPHDVNKDPRANHDAAKTRLKEDDDDAAAAGGGDEPMLNTEASVMKIKSILKRKSYDEVAKPAKRVRFDSTCKNADAQPPLEGFDLLTPRVSENRPSVPDYILNPSKYTRYTLDDDSEAYLEKSSKHGLAELKSSCGELPKSLVFIPRKKRGEEQVKQLSTTQACSTTNVAAVVIQLSEEMQEEEDDESHVDVVCTKARVRQYRSKMEEYDDDDDVS